MSFWTMCQGGQLEQGDYLPRCWIPIISDNFDPDEAATEIAVGTSNLIVVTQTCDLMNDKAQSVALCPIATLLKWEQLDSVYAMRGFWESVRQGRREGLHMLGPFEPHDPRESLAIDFRQIFSLPIGYMRKHAERLGPRRRLVSPFREHFSQAFARFFMRVGLPTAIPPFK